MRTRFERREVYKLTVIGKSNRWVCHYCSCPADELDHIPPTSRYHDATLSGNFQPVVVPACHECNGLASNELHTCFIDRSNFVKSRLQWKYRKQLKVADWSFSELKDMGYSLRKSILKGMATKRFLMGRISFFPIPDESDT